jgi:hypothetical protein
MFDFFAKHTLPARGDVRRIEFATASPSISGQCHWLTIEAQLIHGGVSKVDIQHDAAAGRFHGTTENVARLALDLEHLKPVKALRVELDGQRIDDVAWPAANCLWLERRGDKWSVRAAAARSDKGPHRYGPFREVFRNRMIFVYGTRGTPAENAWALAKARYDAESFWYRGNGAVDVVADSAFAAAADRDRNVILYGHRDSNAAWKALLGDSPIQATRGEIHVGGRVLKHPDLACLFIRPRPGSDTALVGAVSGSGINGLRLTDRLPFFVSGVGYPDCVVLGPESSPKGDADIRAAGFFGLDWGVSTGEFIWRDDK